MTEAKPRTCCDTFMMKEPPGYYCYRCGRVELIRKEESPKLPKVVCVIPARLDSRRLPRKVLLSETGKPLIQYAWEAASAAKWVDGVIIATDSEEVYRIAERFGARAWESQKPHNCGTSRVAEVASFVDREHEGSQADLILNLQADEPDITPEDIDQLVRAMHENPDAQMGTMAWQTEELVEAVDESNVKVVFDDSRRALYFSRNPIPSHHGHQQWKREQPGRAVICRWWIHAGIYAYRREFLLRFAETPQSPLERSEGLEQLRALELGAHIHVEPLSHPTRGIDTEADYRAFVESRLESTQPC